MAEEGVRRGRRGRFGRRVFGSGVLPDHALLFGANGFPGVCAPVLLQAFVDAARVGIRGDCCGGLACVFAGRDGYAGGGEGEGVRAGRVGAEPTGADPGAGEALMAADDEDDEDVGAMAEADASGLLGRNA